jgi:2'-5' RNA ligase
MMLRTFIAVDLPSAILHALAATQEAVQGYLAAQSSGQRGSNLGAALRWSPTENLHLTLRFLGDTNDQQRQEVTAALQELAAMTARFTLAVDVSARGLGGFPNLRQPRVVWSSVQGDRAALDAFQAQTETIAQAAGFAPEERAYSPHLTLARAARDVDRRTLSRAGELIERFSSESVTSELMSFDVERVRFYQSELRAGGSRYTVLAELPFTRF